MNPTGPVATECHVLSSSGHSPSPADTDLGGGVRNRWSYLGRALSGTGHRPASDEHVRPFSAALCGRDWSVSGPTLASPRPMPECHHGSGSTWHRPRPGRERGAEVPGRRRRPWRLSGVVAGYGRACPRPAGPDLDAVGSVSVGVLCRHSGRAALSGFARTVRVSPYPERRATVGGVGDPRP